MTVQPDIEELQRKIDTLEREKLYLSAQNDVLNKENIRLSARAHFKANMKDTFARLSTPALLAGRFAAYAMVGPAAFFARQLLWRSPTLAPYTDRYGKVNYFKPYAQTSLACMAFWFAMGHISDSVNQHRLDAEIDNALANVQCVNGKEGTVGTTKCNDILVEVPDIKALFQDRTLKFIIDRTQDIAISDVVNTAGENGHLKCTTETIQINTIRDNDILNGDSVMRPQVCTIAP